MNQVDETTVQTCISNTEFIILLTMILLRQQAPRCRQEHLHQIRNSPYDAEGAQRCLLLNVRVRGLDETFHLRGQVSGHFRRRYGPKGTEG